MKRPAIIAVILLFSISCTFEIGEQEENLSNSDAFNAAAAQLLSDLYSGGYRLSLQDTFVEVRTESTQSGYPDPQAQEFADTLAAGVATDAVMAVSIQPESIDEGTFDPLFDGNFLYIEIFGPDTADSPDATGLKFIRSSISDSMLSAAYMIEGAGELAGENCNFRITNSLELIVDGGSVREVSWTLSYKIDGSQEVCHRVEEIFYSAIWSADKISDDPLEIIEPGGSALPKTQAQKANRFYYRSEDQYGAPI